MAPPFPLPRLDEMLLRRREQVGAFFARAGWGPWATPITLDAERRRLLNLDLAEPDVVYPAAGEPLAVATFEADREGLVTHVEITAGEPVSAVALAAVLVPGAGEPRTAGGADAREWVWGPESGSLVEVGGEPVRLWVCAERSYGDRLWAVVSVVRRAT